MKSLGVFSTRMVCLFAFVYLTLGVVQAWAQELKWRRIVGLQQKGDVVGVGTAKIAGGTPGPLLTETPELTWGTERWNSK
jgi:hypothetical protein